MSLFGLSPEKKRLRDISAIVWKRSGDPRHSDNNSDADWQAGYLFGCHTETDEAGDDIFDEWIRRGKPDGKNKPFRSWKAGYWGGRYTRL